MLSFLLLAHLLLQVLISIFQFLKLITSIESSCLFSMLRPGTHTEPTELMIALSAGHMVAPLVLLYIPLTPWALFTMGNDPHCVLTLSRVLHIPLLSSVTTAGFMHI